MRVLLIEDDDQMAGFIRKGLKEEGFIVAHATEGESGLHMALTEPFDAAIVDIMLPVMRLPCGCRAGGAGSRRRNGTVPRGNG